MTQDKKLAVHEELLRKATAKEVGGGSGCGHTRQGSGMECCWSSADVSVHTLPPSSPSPLQTFPLSLSPHSLSPISFSLPPPFLHPTSPLLPSFLPHPSPQVDKEMDAERSRRIEESKDENSDDNIQRRETYNRLVMVQEDLLKTIQRMKVGRKGRRKVERWREWEGGRGRAWR